MSTQRYTVTPHPISALLNWIELGEIAIPEIQRPFVWDSTKVRNLLDSLYQGYPVGYLIAWRNPTVKLKDGTRSAGKRILIDGQQRVTALMAAILGREVLNKDYDTINITIAFNPQLERFEVSNPAIRKDIAWLDNVAKAFHPSFSAYDFVTEYCSKNPETSPQAIHNSIENLRKIVNNHVGIIELNEDLDIETVTEIFIRVNSAGAELSQADFAMSKIAVNETYGGNTLRKAIDYFCHFAVAPEFVSRVEKLDPAFARSEYFPMMRWLKDANDDIYDPTYTDMLRVAFTSEFNRGRLQDLVALLSGRNFETKQYEDAIAEQSFSKLRSGVMSFTNETHFKRFTMIIRSAGFETSDLISGQNALNFAYILYLKSKKAGMPQANIERLVRRWYAMSVLRGRYTGSPESAIDFDIRQMESRGIEEYTHSVLENELPESFWTGMLPQLLDTSSTQSPYFLAYKAAQIKLNDRGFLSRSIDVKSLILNKCDVHHIYPKNYLKKQGLPRVKYNNIANFVLTQSEINIAISDRAPDLYFQDLLKQCTGGPLKYGGIDDQNALLENLKMNCIPEDLLQGEAPDYDVFLGRRRQLMALKMKDWYLAL
jgi:hypothetical protein